MIAAGPPDRPVKWRAYSAATKSSCEVVAQLWHEAREKACALLGCGKDEVEVRQVES